MLLIEYYREFCASATESLYIFWWSLAKSWHFSVSRSSYSCPLAFEHIGYRLLIHESLLCLECDISIWSMRVMEVLRVFCPANMWSGWRSLRKIRFSKGVIVPKADAKILW